MLIISGLSFVIPNCKIFQGLRLFNFDMIREHGRKDRYYVIDINYFPGESHSCVVCGQVGGALCSFLMLCHHECSTIFWTVYQ